MKTWKCIAMNGLSMSNSSGRGASSTNKPLPSQRDGMFIAKRHIPDNLPSQRDGMFIEKLFTK